MKAISLFLLTICTALLFSCVGTKDYAVISTEISSEFPASDIKSISINGPFTVNIVNDGSNTVTLIANQFILNETTVNINSSGDLIATVGNVGSIKQPEKFKLTLNIPAKSLKTIHLNGAVSCTYEPEEICTEKGSISLKGASRLTIKGDAFFTSDVQVEISDAGALFFEEGTLGVQGNADFSISKAGTAKINSALFSNKITISLSDAAHLKLAGNQTNDNVTNSLTASDATKYEGFGFTFHKVEISSKNVSQIETAISDYLGLRLYDVASVQYRKMSSDMIFDPLEVQGGSIKKID